jgi:peptide deformylase
LAKDMIDTMYASDGIGIAAPQVGESIQLCVANPSQVRGRELILINPVIALVEGRTSYVEGCLSLPRAWGRVRRSARVRVRARDLSGEPIDIETEGLLAVVLQHEYDHLLGKLFVDRLSWVERRRLAKSRQGVRS